MVERILVTGATGFIGSHLVKRLVELGYDTFSMVTPFERCEELYMELLKGSTVISADLRDRPSLDKALRVARPKVVFSLGAYTSVAESFNCPVAYSEVNIIGTINLAVSCMKNNIEKMIHTCSPEMLQSRAEPYKEDEYVPGRNSPYGISKFDNYLYLKHIHETYDLPGIIALPNNVFHRKTSRYYITEKIVTGLLSGKLKLYGQPGDDEDSVRNWTFIDDVVDGFVAVMEKGEPGETYHLCRKDYCSISEVVEKAKRVINPEAEVVWSVGVPRPYNPKYLLLDPSWTYERLKWQPKISVEEGLKRVADYWRSKI